MPAQIGFDLRCARAKRRLRFLGHVCQRGVCWYLVHQVWGAAKSDQVVATFYGRHQQAVAFRRENPRFFAAFFRIGDLAAARTVAVDHEDMGQRQCACPGSEGDALAVWAG